MSDSANYLVVGSGSIACRHIANLKTLFADCTVSCVSASGRTLNAKSVGADFVHQTWEQAKNSDPTFAIVASPAPMHIKHAAELLRAGVPVLVEKPLADTLTSFNAERETFYANGDKVAIAYNMRFLPSSQKIKVLLDENIIGRLHSVMIDVGQYLPDWRPGTDYKKNVSARRDLGGGVLLELSHELDYLTWLFGEFDIAYCIATNSGSLDIDVEDNVDAIFSRKNGMTVTLHMDFLQRTVSRRCKIIGETGTLIWDLMQNSITLYTPKNQEMTLYSDPKYDRNSMYLDELQHFAEVAEGKSKPMVDVPQALYTLGLIEALKHASAQGQAINIKDFTS